MYSGNRYGTEYPVIKNTITSYDINNTNSIIEPDLSGVSLKIVRNKPIRMDTEEYVNITEYFYKFNKFLILMADVMFFNRGFFKVISSRKLKSATVEHIPSQKSDQLSKILNKVIKLYGIGGFHSCMTLV